MLPYSQEIDHCFGAGGVKRAAYEANLKAAHRGVAAVLKAQEHNDLPLYNLPARRDDLIEIDALAAEIRSSFSRLVVLGTGGSSLGAKMLVALRGPDFAGDQFPVHFMENVDPVTMESLLDGIDVQHTAFLAVSKSGGTAETLSQFLLCIAALRDAVGQANVGRHCYVVTEPGDRPLRALAEKWNMNVLDHDPKVGGRFSVLSLVGLIPAAVAGIDVHAVRTGAAAVMDSLHDPDTSLPVQGAALGWAMEQAGKSDFVLMPYCDRLAEFSKWFRQLWAESLGKEGKGTTPIDAMGAIDQHSQLQLYLDGPKNKYITCVFPDASRKGPAIDPALIEDARLDYLPGRTIGDVMDAEQRATAETLIASGCPVRVLRMPELDARALGALLMHYMLETVIQADLMEIDAYDQPAVEDSKIRTRKYLSELSLEAA